MAIDAIDLEVFRHRFAAIAEEMGTALRRSAFSPNIKERRDYSCALFDASGELVAQAAHIPVHLGSAALSVQAAMAQVEMEEGDVVLLNDPYQGGTHLPDVTTIAPFFRSGARRPFAYLANRAHHADIGGGTPGSMALATEIYQEGLRLPPVRLIRAGRMNDDILRVFLANTRVTDERRGDLLAQLAALRTGATRLAEVIDAYDVRTTRDAMRALQDYSERRMRRALAALPRGVFRATDWLDDDGTGSGRIALCVAVTIGRGFAKVDFTGSAPQVAGGVNANYAVTLAAVLYVFQLLAGEEIAANAGLGRPIEVVAPEGSVVNAAFPAAVAGGNVETSQRIVDVLLKALGAACPERIPAASNGSMNNVSLGGWDTRYGRSFAYYETIGGGCGAGPQGDGGSAMHSHMTNTYNTPVEALEAAYPLRVTEYSIRRRSGGAGLHRGGDGIVREYEALVPMTATILGERRKLAPYGANGGEVGRRGRAERRSQGFAEPLPGKTSIALAAGERLRVETPGGGGWGKKKPRRR